MGFVTPSGRVLAFAQMTQLPTAGRSAARHDPRIQPKQAYRELDTGYVPGAPPHWTGQCSMFSQSVAESFSTRRLYPPGILDIRSESGELHWDKRMFGLYGLAPLAEVLPFLRSRSAAVLNTSPVVNPTPGMGTSPRLPKLLYVEDDEDLVSAIRAAMSGRVDKVAATILVQLLAQP
jgi:hypothetical protein